MIYLKDGAVIALDSVNAVKDYVQGRKLVENCSTPDPKEFEDISLALK